MFQAWNHSLTIPSYHCTYRFEYVLHSSNMVFLNIPSTVFTSILPSVTNILVTHFGNILINFAPHYNRLSLMNSSDSPFILKNTPDIFNYILNSNLKSKVYFWSIKTFKLCGRTSTHFIISLLDLVVPNTHQFLDGCYPLPFLKLISCRLNICLPLSIFIFSTIWIICSFFFLMTLTGMFIDFFYCPSF